MMQQPSPSSAIALSNLRSLNVNVLLVWRFSFYICDLNLGFTFCNLFSFHQFLHSSLFFSSVWHSLLYFTPLSMCCPVCCFSRALSEEDAYVDKLPTFERHFDSLAGIVTVHPAWWWEWWGFKVVFVLMFLVQLDILLMHFTQNASAV